MTQKLRMILISILVLVWALAGAQGISIALEQREGRPARLDAEAHSLANLAATDLVERTGLSAKAIHVQSIERTEFPDASLGAPEPGVSYPQAPVSGYHIRLKAGYVVYRYWAAGGRTVYVGSYLAMPDAGTGSN
jgi:hypothetical protein